MFDTISERNRYFNRGNTQIKPIQTLIGRLIQKPQIPNSKPLTLPPLEKKGWLSLVVWRKGPFQLKYPITRVIGENTGIGRLKWKGIT